MRGRQSIERESYGRRDGSWQKLNNFIKLQNNLCEMETITISHIARYLGT